MDGSPAFGPSVILDAVILIVVQQARLLMFLLNIVNPLAVKLNHSYSLSFFCAPSCLKVIGGVCKQQCGGVQGALWWAAHMIFVSSPGLGCGARA